MAELSSLSTITATGLQAYYKQESGALTTDSSGNTRTLTNNGTITSVAGKYGGASDFGSSNSSKYYSRASSPVSGTGAWTVGTWFKSTASGITQRMVSMGANASGQAMALDINSSNFLSAVIFGGSSLSDNIAVNDGNWHLAVITYGGTTVSIYLDGEFRKSGTRSYNLGSTNFSMGRSFHVASEYFSGQQDDTFIFNKTLTNTEIREIYEELKSGYFFISY